jgi:hypothetical protein
VNTQEVAIRIVKRLRACKGRIGSQDDAAARAVEIIQNELDRAIAAHDSCEPATIAKGPKS